MLVLSLWEEYPRQPCSPPIQRRERGLSYAIQVISRSTSLTSLISRVAVSRE